MPVLSIEELGEIAPIFKGSFGHALAAVLMKAVSFDKVNDLYDRISSNQGVDFAAAYFKDQNAEYSVGNPQRLDHLPKGAFITISNHAYGHVDGLSMVDLFGHFRPCYKVLVNKILARVKALSQSLITVIPTGKVRTEAKSESIDGIKKVLRQLSEGEPVGFFPSGAVSDLSLRERCIRDRQWQEPIIRVIKKARVPIVPVRFFDHNSMFYYWLGALLGPEIRLLRLPTEALNKSGVPIRIGIGETISVERQSEFSDLDTFRSFLRSSVYDMPLPSSFTPRGEIL